MNLLSHRLIVLFLLCSFALLANGQSPELRESLFSEADAALAEARKAGANLLAPRSFSKGMEYYNSATGRFERGREIAAIRSDLAEAIDYFNRASAATARAGIAMGALLKTRNDAEKAGAKKYAGELWLKAEEKLTEIALENERERDKAVARMTPAAEAAYREAELAAIKASYLSETERLLEEAKDRRASRYAPKTLAEAKRLLERAERELTENRYDTDLPRSLAQQAQYEAQHAIYLARILERARKERLSDEDLILEWEEPIRRIAAQADLVARFDAGYEQPTQAIIAYLDNLQTSNRTLGADLADREQEIKQLQLQIADLERSLGGVSQERVALSMQLEQQAAARAKFARVEQMFERGEAQVLRDGEVIVLRLIGLTFPSGRAEVPTEQFGLLAKVIRALQEYPGADVVVEGHTDSYGSDSVNLNLSEERASAVMKYLLANAGVAEDRVRSFGYGETRPIGNNETAEGRARNRRIDIAIVPAK